MRRDRQEHTETQKEKRMNQPTTRNDMEDIHNGNRNKTSRYSFFFFF